MQRQKATKRVHEDGAGPRSVHGAVHGAVHGQKPVAAVIGPLSYLPLPSKKYGYKDVLEKVWAEGVHGLVDPPTVYVAGL